MQVRYRRHRGGLCLLARAVVTVACLMSYAQPPMRPTWFAIE